MEGEPPAPLSGKWEEPNRMIPDPPAPRVPPAELFDDPDEHTKENIEGDPSLETYEPGGERPVDLDKEVPF